MKPPGGAAARFPPPANQPAGRICPAKKARLEDVAGTLGVLFGLPTTVQLSMSLWSTPFEKRRSPESPCMDMSRGPFVAIHLENAPCCPMRGRGGSRPPETPIRRPGHWAVLVHNTPFAG